MTVIGELDKQTGDLLEEIYRELDAPIIRKTVEVAEMIKYTSQRLARRQGHLRQRDRQHRQGGRRRRPRVMDVI